jgi:hypothetical protein
MTPICRVLLEEAPQYINRQAAGSRNPNRLRRVDQRFGDCDRFDVHRVKRAAW